MNIRPKTQQGIAIDSSKWVMPKMTKPFGFLKGLTKVLYGVATGAIPAPTGSIFHATTGLAEILESFELKKDTGQVGWQLLYRSLLDAFYRLLSESIHDLDMTFVDKDMRELDGLDDKLKAIFETEQYYVFPDFFKQPEKHPLLEASSSVFDEYLQRCGYNAFQTKNLLGRLKIYFVSSLVDEWRKAPSTYQTLLIHLDTPFADAESKSYQWLRYRQSLKDEVAQPVFQELFSLRDIFIPLRAYYEIHHKDTNKQEILERETKKGKVFEIEKFLLDWIDSNDISDCIKIISGGPGSGKSSLLKILAAKLAEQEKNVLFIPLHRFDLKSDLEESLKMFLNYDKLITTFNPMDEDNIVLIFDGLDELDMQGGLLADIAQNFIREVKSKTDKYNHNTAKLKIIISGRDVIVQQNQSSFRKEGQHLRLLPYLIDNDTKKIFEQQEKLINEDQRGVWWAKYGQLKGKDYQGLPKDLQKVDLDEITAHPLLNYLFTLSYERGIIVFSENVNLNTVYKDLLEAVYERSYSRGGRIKNLSSLTEEDFTRLLEEIAVSAWHGNGRKTSIREIKSHFDSSGLNCLMEQFTKDAEKGVISLLAAFYFRQAGEQMDGSKTFEFTHKSFGEYLMAKRIIEQTRVISRKMMANKKNYDEGWDIKEGLKKWIKLFGPKVLDDDIVKFIRNEVSIIQKEELKDIHAIICELINYELKNGLPIEREEVGPRSYKEENLYAINAEKGLFVIRSLIAMETNERSIINWTSNTDFGNLLKRIVEQWNGEIVFMQHFFNNINIDNQRLDFQDLFEINLFNSSLIRSSLIFSILIEASLRKADLSRADLSRANLNGAFLREANLNGANLGGANLNGADLSRANLNGANLSGADLRRANLSRANLEEAFLREAFLIGANLIGANLNGANLDGANLSGADLRGADLRGADLDGANLSGADLRGADLRGAILPDRFSPK